MSMYPCDPTMLFFAMYFAYVVTVWCCYAAMCTYEPDEIYAKMRHRAKCAGVSLIPLLNILIFLYYCFRTKDPK